MKAAQTKSAAFLFYHGMIIGNFPIILFTGINKQKS